MEARRVGGQSDPPPRTQMLGRADDGVGVDRVVFVEVREGAGLADVSGADTRPSG